MQVSTVVHWVRIRVVNKPGGDQVLFFKYWAELPWHVRVKYTWYFKYRAALAQVQFPKAEVEFHWGHSEPKAELVALLNKRRLAEKKGRLNKWKRSLQLAKENWNQLFPIEEDRDFKRALAKVEALENEINQL